MTDDQVVDLLAHDMSMEHQAILQYLFSAWVIGGEVGPSIESVARDEMRHFKYFGLAIVELGGKPRMEGPAFQRLTDPTAIVLANAASEDEAVKVYTQHRELIPDPRVKKLYDRIIEEEMYHGQKFQRMVAKVEGMPPVEFHEPQSPQQETLFRFLEEDIAGEYAAILRYLHQSFIVADGKLGNAIEDRAIDEMKHMGWMAEHKIDSGGEPVLQPAPVQYSTELPEIFRYNIQLEKGAEERYQRHIDGYEDPDLQRVWAHIKFQEEHHTDDFENRLADLNRTPETQATTSSDASNVKPKTSVGSLFGKPQS
ncbi:MAG TPA: ferritin-like domain-containing protein [Candidatus Latescibacteria bacterium]|nr:MAG: Bacterioferritin [Candidatus Latescibacteria bacterium ADurb.Bin168]HPU84323.1 ferritin-like domain-containing protein [Candidatus Latescibacterota bacterium]